MFFGVDGSVAWHSLKLHNLRTELITRLGLNHAGMKIEIAEKNNYADRDESQFLNFSR